MSPTVRSLDGTKVPYQPQQRRISLCPLCVFPEKEIPMTRMTAPKKMRPTNVELHTGDGAAALSADELRKIDAYWRACNYLAAGMIYLRDNPLLRKPLKPEHIKV